MCWVLGVLILCLAALFFPASADGYVRGERGHPQSPGPPTGSMVSTGFHFFYRNKNGGRRDHCLTPVFIMKESVRCPA